MKRIFIKISILALLSLLFMTLSYCIDTFNIFHWNNIRITKAEPNKNYVKSKYILANPQKFNAFAFGSSRIGNLDLENLPKELNGVHLNWYNMTYSQGIPSEHLQNIKTFLKNGIEIKWIILEFDDIFKFFSSISSNCSTTFCLFSKEGINLLSIISLIEGLFLGSIFNKY